jgi:hypothetical protein
MTTFASNSLLVLRPSDCLFWNYLFNHNVEILLRVELYDGGGVELRVYCSLFSCFCLIRFTAFVFSMMAAISGTRSRLARKND